MPVVECVEGGDVALGLGICVTGAPVTPSVPAPWAEANVVGANKSEAAMMAEKPNRDCMGGSIVDDDGQPPVLFDVPDRTAW
ncbi:hypothetical protein [Tardiphaga sp. 841_E9_N1_2]|jgi:hypothetical protein|uniref:hypothetical protein n=1 Tax=Tardiphaga sp. 841_E9_N1_2 TaxID=3240762 RepID=UPI003F259C57